MIATLALRRLPLFMIVACLALMAEGAALASGHTKFAALPVAVVALVYLLRRPTLLLIVPIAYLSIASRTYLKIGHLGLAEATLCIGIVIVVLRGELEIEPTGVFMGILIATSMNGLLVAGGHGISFHDAFIAGRDTLGFLAYWVALALFRHDIGRTVTVLGWLACIVAAVSIAQEIFQHRVLFLGASDPTLIVRNQSGYLRVRLPGDIIYVGEFFAIAYLLWGPASRRRIALVIAALLGAAVLVSLNRNWIIGLFIGLLVAWVLGRPDTRTTIRILVLAFASASVLMAAGGTAIGSRILSLGNAAGLEQSTLSDRQYEDGFAERALRLHPVVGVGWAPYGASVTDISAVPKVRGFIHNQYLGVWLRSGIIGLLALVAVLLRSLFGALRAFRRRDSRDWVGAGAAAAVVGVAASSVVGIYLQQEASAATFATLAALCTIVGSKASDLGLSDADGPVGKPT